MAKRSAKGCVVAAVIWIIILGCLAVAAKFLVLPQLQKEKLKKIAADPRYKSEIVVAADSFSGYAVLRSEAVRNALASRDIRLTVQDDGGDYAARLESLRRKQAQMAVFTVDSFIQSGAKAGGFPASIVLVIDETKGADAIVAYKSRVQSLQDINDPQGRFVFTPQSPSEFLARTVMAHFSLPSLPEKWWIEKDGSADVLKEFKKADRGLPRAYVMWEPQVSEALQDPDAHVLLDSSKLKGYVVDVLVAEHDFLLNHSEDAKLLVEAYLRAAYDYSAKPEGMAGLVLTDARESGSERLSQKQAEAIANGIEWKNTLENFAYFGLLPREQARGMQHIEDVIDNIVQVLLKTGAMGENPVAGKVNTLYHDRLLRELQTAGFHPARKIDLIPGLGPGADELEKGRVSGPLRALSNEEWDRLVPVGELSVAPISFGRGNARLSIQSQRDLDDLARKMESFPAYYIVATGNSRAEGDEQANMRLADERARAAADYLISKGVDIRRIKSRAARPTAQNGEAQSVSFILGQAPY
jgi:outer membrane protein OmpA-like peptidoglycan-associated protein